MKGKFKAFLKRLLSFLKASAVGLILVGASIGVMIATNNVHRTWTNAVESRMNEVRSVEGQRSHILAELQALQQSASTSYSTKIDKSKVSADTVVAEQFFEHVLAWSSAEEAVQLRTELQSMYAKTLSSNFADAIYGADVLSQEVLSYEIFVVEQPAKDAYSYGALIYCNRVTESGAERICLWIRYLVGTNNNIYDFYGDVLR